MIKLNMVANCTRLLEARVFPHERFVCNGLEVVRLGETGMAAESELVGRY